jgi:hypothetical protein
VTNHHRPFHVWLGLGGVLIFLYTGLYMRWHFPEAYSNQEAVRYLFRANHVYILLAALLNLAVGFYLSEVGPGGTRKLTAVASLLVVAALPLLVYAFFVEPPKASPERPVTVFGIVCVAAGTGLHGVAVMLRRRARDRAPILNRQ